MQSSVHLLHLPRACAIRRRLWHCRVSAGGHGSSRLLAGLSQARLRARPSLRQPEERAPPPASGAHRRGQRHNARDVRLVHARCRWLVEEAANGEAALYAAALFEPDVIVMDLRLPVLDGVEVTRRLKETELTRHIPIVACSALDRAAADALNAGCSAFVTKPCPPEDLRALVESLARTEVRPIR